MNPRPAAAAATTPETAPASASAAATRHRGGIIPDEIIIWEIVPRLPARAVLRCRAVCRSWRKALASKSNSDLLVAHHRLQPSLPVASCFQSARHDLRAVAPRSAALAPVATLRHPTLQVRASCDGLLVLSLSPASYYVCNPATREWLLQPFFPHFLGFYPHRPSGEYRILHGTGPPSRSRHKASYSVFTVGSRKPRGIGRPAASSSEEKALAEGIVKTAPDRPSILLHQSLHFYPVKKKESNSSSNMVMVFSTTAESFRWMTAPDDVPASATLFEMDGKLGLSAISDDMTEVDIRVLPDYGSELWEFKLRLKLPAVEMNLSAARRSFIEVVVSEEGGVLVSNFSRIAHADAEGKLLSDFQYPEQSLMIVPYKLKESLLRHAFFPRRDAEDANASLSPFINTDAISKAALTG
ncbi:hypothetical protein QYE76_038174 [Lolium multiflorum]|uniref:F-box associated beta-propeller type 3 domain-containing protein n=1 Tax=Lolium multiflorum TaxID=4521 RepID=A0AAD8WSN4_LOLMU|nr:hypothetical protein QYE76_038174 [Lolium multiflorum]